MLNIVDKLKEKNTHTYLACLVGYLLQSLYKMIKLLTCRETEKKERNGDGEDEEEGCLQCLCFGGSDSLVD